MPAILAATDPTLDKPPRVVVSTHTISLQEQLIRKDLPLLNSVIPREFSAVLVKGRRNYISLRRLQAALGRSSSLFDDDEAIDQLARSAHWSEQTERRLAEPTSTTSRCRQVWDEVASDSGNCLGRRCPTYDKCFYYQDRRRVQHAQILVVNHALFFSDLALRRQGVSILPDYDVVVLDEAHTVEAVAADHLGLSLTSGQVEYVLSQLYNDRTQKGLLVHHGLQGRCASRSTSAGTRPSEYLCRRVGVEEPVGAQPTGGVSAPLPTANKLSPELLELARGVKQAGDAHQAGDRAAGFHRGPRPADRAGRRAERLARAAACRRGVLGRVELEPPRHAAADARRRADRRRPRAARAAVPAHATVILTSATLSIGKRAVVRLLPAADRADAVRRAAARQPVRLPRAGRADHAARHARPRRRARRLRAGVPSRRSSTWCARATAGRSCCSPATR